MNQRSPRRLALIAIASATWLSACTQTTQTLATLTPADTQDATTIMQRAYDAAGGDQWRRPETLSMHGYAVFYRDGVANRHERHDMWRVYDWSKRDAHQADGKVRIESVRDGRTIIDLSFDGNTTYTAKGPQPKSAADQQWSSSFGFGVIRHALDDGYALNRMPDDLVDGKPAYVIKISDPSGGETFFAIAQADAAILRVGFDTPRGWHERIYSNFFENQGVDWRQPGRVRLYYNGIKANEVIWTSFALNDALPDCLFVLPETTSCRSDNSL